VSTGIRGQKGGRKAPSFVNLAWTIYPHFFWDGRAKSLELGPIENPIEMGNTHENVVKTLTDIKGYAPYFKEAFGTEEVTIQRVGKAIADYERTRLSGNSPWDRWQAGDEKAVSAEVKLGTELFNNKAECSQCHLGENFTDNRFHNLGIGWNPQTKEFADKGRFEVTKNKANSGDFKTPSLREVAKRAPYMHDGSIPDLLQVVEHYNKGGTRNPYLSPKIRKLNLTQKEKMALVAMMESLSGEGYLDPLPKVFPQ
jgi:cytochrome c peroxidase